MVVSDKGYQMLLKNHLHLNHLQNYSSMIYNFLYSHFFVNKAMKRAITVEWRRKALPHQELLAKNHCHFLHIPNIFSYIGPVSVTVISRTFAELINIKFNTMSITFIKQSNGKRRGGISASTVNSHREQLVAIETLSYLQSTCPAVPLLPYISQRFWVGIRQYLMAR